MYKSPDWGREGRGKELEQSHVYSIYDQIAPCFSEISQKAWPNVRKFLKNQSSGSLIADIGCGSGRYLHINKHTYKIGLDICCPLVENARTKGNEVMVADNLRLPFRNQMFDAVISIGVVHHFSTIERRIEAVQELARILHQGGQLMIYVWAYEQKHRRFDGQDVLIPWHGGHKHLGSLLQASCSDKDVSSISSISEDESSTDSVFSTCTLERTASETFKDIIQDSDDVFLEDFNQNEKLKSIRTRSNTLPCTLEGFKSSRRENNHYKTKKQGSSTLAEECRKIEASLKAMSEIHHRSEIRGNGVDNVSQKGETYNPTFSKLKIAQTSTLSVNGKSECHIKSPLKSVENRRDRMDNLLQKSFNADLRLSQALSQTYLPEKCLDNFQNIAPCPNVKSCHVSSQKSHQGPGHFQNGYHEDSKAKVTTLNIKLDPSKTTDFSFFDIIKMKVKKFIDRKTGEEQGDVYQHSKSAYHGAWKMAQDIGNMAFGNSVPFNDMEEFAVREFPMSSCPEYRKEMNDKSKNHLLSTESEASFKNNGHHSINEHSACVSIENGHVDDSDNSVKTNCVRKNLKVPHRQMTDHSNSADIFDNHVVKRSPRRVDKHIKHHTLRKTGKSKSCSSFYEKHSSTFSVTDSLTQFSESKSHSSEKKSFQHAPPINGCHDTKALRSKHYTRRSSDVLHNKLNENNSCLQSNKHYLTSHDMSYDKPVKSCDINNGSQQQNGAFHVLCKNQISGISNGRGSKQNDLREKLPKHSVSNCAKSKTTVSETSTSASQPEHITTNGLDLCTKQITSENYCTELCRYYHVFKEGELLNLIKTHVKSLHVISCTLDHGNWCIVTEKL